MRSARFAKYIRPALLLLLTLAVCGGVFSACGRSGSENEQEGEIEIGYEHISMEQAQSLMETEEDRVILDVRREDEYASGHIPGAVCLPNETISAETAGEVLPEKDQLILVYCRSGRRSREAAGKLADLGYSNVKEFGGILDWPGEIEK